MSLYDRFWVDSFWLPANSTWTELERHNDFQFGRTTLYVCLTAVLVYVTRHICENYIARPVGRYFHIAEHEPNKFPADELLEAYFEGKGRHPAEAVFKYIAESTGQSCEQVQAWHEWRSSLSRPSRMSKFTECFWRFTFYTSIWLYGAHVLWSKPWAWSALTGDGRLCWTDHASSPITRDVYLYYVLELGFYLSLFVSQFRDIRRKDFWQMFLHHVCTISLLAYSYMSNHTRIGAAILVLHDNADLWLELAKMGVYAKVEWVSTSCFAMFTITWFVTRLVIFPAKILYTTTYVAATELGGLYPAFHVFNAFLYILQILHIIWFFMILKVLHRTLTSGTVGRDDRSDSDAASELPDPNPKEQ